MDGRSSARAALRDNLIFWNNFFSGCIARRVDTDQFQRVVVIAQRDHPLPPAAIADIFLRPTTTNDISLDPSVPLYLQTLSSLGFIDTPSILKALYKYSSSQHQVRQAQQQLPAENSGDEAQKDKEKKPRCWSNSYWVEEYMFYRLVGAVVENRVAQDSEAVLEVVRIVSKWMVLFTAVSSAFADATMEQAPHVREAVRRDGMESSRAAFVALLLRLCESQPLIRTITKQFAKDARKDFSDSLGKFIPTLHLSPAVTEKLEMFRSQTLAKLDPLTKKQEAANAAMESLLDSTVGLDNFFVPEIPIANTRAGLYIYLHASLISRPTLDDHAFFSYLNIRYQGDNMSAASDLILASFDLLATSVFRNEIQKEAHLLKSFLINKVPLLISQLLPPQFSGTSTEEVVKKTLEQVDQSLFPTASAMFDQSRNSNPYTESIREEFCASCVLHGLVSRDHLEQILGEDFMSNDAREKYSKDKLVGDCLADSERIKSLVGEIEKMDGNVGAVCQAIVEVIRQLCNGKETMTLKIVCSQLAQKPPVLDVILLFEKLPTVLGPLCNLLDNWRYEEDQGEYQPVYEEYGAVLLLVLAFAYRYQLAPLEVGSQLPDGAVATILGRAHVAREVAELSEKEKEHLNGWISGLFDSDTGGLGDELMSSCPPKDFYLLIATLFYNTVTAYTHGHLSDESLKSGVEYLVDTFLLPSLVPAILFLSEYLWVDSKEQKSVLRVLQLILLPKSISGEASTMLTAVKNLIAKPLEHALRTCQKRDPSCQDIEPLLRALTDSLRMSRRTSGAEHNELEQWSAAQSSGLASTIKQSIRALVSWSMNPATNMMPTAYSHRQIMTGVRMLGAKRVLYLIMECVQQQSENGSANVVYDVATAIVCAPDEAAQVGHLEAAGNNVSPAVQRLLTLREVLKTEAEDCKRIQKEDSNMAEMLVRLHRRVEAQMVVPPQAVLQAAEMAPMDLDGQAAMAAAAAAGAAGMTGDLGVDAMGMGMGLPGDLNLGGPSTGGLDVTGDGSDLFGNLGDADMGDMNVGDMNVDFETLDGWNM